MTTHPSCRMLCQCRGLRLAFALLFFYARIFLIVPFVYLYSMDLWVLFSDTKQYPVQDLVMVLVLYVCCISLSVLQFVWGKVILEGVLKAVGLMGGSSKSKRKRSDPEIKTREPRLNRTGLAGAVGQLQEAVEHLEVAELDVRPLDPMESVPSPQMS